MERTTIDDRDYDDAVKLGAECGVATIDELRAVFRQFFPDEDLPPKAKMRLEELARDIRVKLG